MYGGERSHHFPFVCVIGPDYGCNAAAWFLILAISLAFLSLVALKLHVGVLIGNAATLAILLCSFAVTSLSDPGYMPRQTAEQLAADRIELAEKAHVSSSGIISVMPPRAAGSSDVVDVAAANGFTACGTCHVLRERGTLHCYDCARCVRELDHHCPWSGKCIGKGNLTAFKTFLGALLLHSAFTGVSFITYIVGFRG